MKRRRAWDEAAMAADRARALALVDVSRETSERLDRFVEALLRWQSTINLIAPSTVERIWTRHIADSLQLLRHAPEACAWADLGSGAGFPGLVLACALDSTSRVHLVESDTRKAAFLRETAAALAIPAVIHNKRIEDVADNLASPIEVVTARALAPLPKLLDYAAPLIERGAQALLLKGQDVEAELTEAAKSWHMDVELLPSVTDPAGRIVWIRSLRRMGAEEAASK